MKPLWKTVWRLLKKLEMPYDPAIPLLGITITGKDTCTLMFREALFTIAKTWKQPDSPLTDEWIKKMCFIYIYIYIYIIQWNITQPQKKNEIMPFAATWMDLEIIILSKVCQKEKDKYRMISLVCGI